MLSDKQKEQLSAEVVPLFQELEQDIIQDIARRVRKEKRWTETAELQAKTLEAMGYRPVEIRNKVMRELKADKAYQAMIAKNTLEHKREVKARISQAVLEAKAQGDDIVSRAGAMAFSDDLSFWKSKGRHLRYSPELGKINQSAAKRLAHELKDLTHSTGFKFIGAPIREDRVFSHAMDSAIMNIASGGFSSGQAVEQVVSDLEKSGIRHVDFGSGISRGIDVAAALAVRTTLGQMAAEISMSNAEELGTDLVEVSSHAGAREGTGHASHVDWQGKVYSISGKAHPEEEKRLGYPIEKLSDATGYPDDPTGLCGYNCRHTFYPFIEGISEPNPIEKDPEPVTVDGRTYTYYQATQVQRRIERELRELKRQYIGGDTKRLAAIKAKEQQYARFCRKAGLKQNLERIYVKGYKRDFEYIKTRETVESRSLKGYNNYENWTTKGLQSLPSDVSNTNPNYGKGKEWSINCQRCVPALEMRRRGYDVSAKPNYRGVTDSHLSKYPEDAWVNPRISNYASKSDIESEVKKWGDGARGQIIVNWNRGGGHTFAVENVKGSVVFVDPQTGNLNCKKYFDYVKTGTTKLFRIDSLQPSSYITDCCEVKSDK